jgi:hypothetical protein
MRRVLGLSLLLVGMCAWSAVAADDDGWIVMFDGKDLDGWKINERPESWSVKDGAIVANGDRSHLFYVGDGKPFKNFEFQGEVQTRKNSNAGIYFHTKYQPEGWPKYGFEAQVNNTYTKDPIKTGSLYQVVNVTEAPAPDDVWFPYNIKVEGKHIVVTVNGKKVVDYTEPEGKEAGKDFTRVVDEGTFALQAHDPGSTVMFRNLKVRRLP